MMVSACCGSCTAAHFYLFKSTTGYVESVENTMFVMQHFDSRQKDENHSEQTQMEMSEQNAHRQTHTRGDNNLGVKLE